MRSSGSTARCGVAPWWRARLDGTVRVPLDVSGFAREGHVANLGDIRQGCPQLLPQAPPDRIERLAVGAGTLLVGEFPLAPLAGPGTDSLPKSFRTGSSSRLTIPSDARSHTGSAS
jgi:hypothetical protein